MLLHCVTNKLLSNRQYVVYLIESAKGKHTYYAH